MKLVEFIVVGSVAGWILGHIRHGRGYGFLRNLMVGAIGSLIGWFMMGFLRIRAPNLLTEIVLAVAGAIIFFLILGLFKGKIRRKKSEEDDE